MARECIDNKLAWEFHDPDTLSHTIRKMSEMKREGFVRVIPPRKPKFKAPPRPPEKPKKLRAVKSFVHKRATKKPTIISTTLAKPMKVRIFLLDFTSLQ